MNDFDAWQFKADYETLRTYIEFHTPVAQPVTYEGAETSGSGRWLVTRRKPGFPGWTVVGPDGLIHMFTGTSRSEWRTAALYAHQAAQVLA